MKDPDWYDSGLPHIWLPYTRMQTATPLPVASTDGCKITLADGRELIDGIASWWTACHGYNHPHIRQGVEKQLAAMPHVMFGGLVHEPALTLAKRLSALTGLERVFFGDSGSVAVEIALKMALQYWQQSGKPEKNRFVCFHGGYHGDTMGAMSVSDPEHSMHSAFAGAVPKQYVADINDLRAFETLLATHKDIAAVILEPLVQCAEGMRFHSAETLAEIHRITKKHGVLFIADEIATGFGRTGRMFACQEANITPDILCIGKALTGGTMTLAATLAQSFIFDAFTDAFMHGPTYMANPLACAAANASLDLFEREPRLKQVAAIESQLREELEPCRKLPGVIDVRVKGAIGVVQVEKMDIPVLRKQFAQRGVWIRPIKDVIYLMPAFTITPEELGKLTGSVREVLK